MPEQLSFAGFEPPPSLPPSDRLFFAIFPDADAIARIAGCARRLRGELKLTGKTLAPDRFHITLHHIDDYAGLPSGVVGAAHEAASSVKAPPFEVAFDRAMSFKGAPGNRPFVLLGGDGVNALSAFRRTLGAAVTNARIGRPVAPKFTPHVTLLYDGEQIVEQVIEPIGWIVREFVLVHSLLGQTRHVILGRWPLNG